MMRKCEGAPAFEYFAHAFMLTIVTSSPPDMPQGPGGVILHPRLRMPNSGDPGIFFPAAPERTYEPALKRAVAFIDGQNLFHSVRGAIGYQRDVYRQMQRETSTAGRLRRVFDRLGSYPEWPDWLQRELDAFYVQLAPNQRQGRLIGRELDAALDDPRWQAVVGEVIKREMI